MRLHPSHIRPGATLVEIMVVIALIGTLSTLSFVAFTVARNYGSRLENDLSHTTADVNRHMLDRPGAQPIHTAPPPPRPLPVTIPGEFYVAFNPGVNANVEAQRL